MLKLIVFDWDGTLADSVSKIWECKKFLAKKFGLAVPSEETIRNVLGMKFEEALAICFPAASPSTFEELAKEYHFLMQQEIYQATLFSYAKEILESLKTKKLKLAIATSKNRNELNTALAYNHLSNFFDATCCGHEFKSKPDPAMLQHLIKVFNVQTDECIMIGDTIYDIIFARNAEVKTICVTFGAHSVSKLQSEQPLALINDWSKLPEILNTLKDKELCHPLSAT